MRALIGLLLLTASAAHAQDDPKPACAETIVEADLMASEADAFKKKVETFAMSINTIGFGPQQVTAVGEVRQLRHQLLADLEAYRQKAEDLAYAMRVCAR